MTFPRSFICLAILAVISAAQTCPDKFSILYTGKNIPVIENLYGVLGVTMFTKQSSLKNGLPWYIGVGPSVVPSVEGKNPELYFFATPVEESAVWFFAWKEHLPGDFAEDVAPTGAGGVRLYQDKALDSWCQGGNQNITWEVYVDTAGDFVQVQGADMHFSLAASEDGSACSGDADCKTGQCVNGKCGCKDKAVQFTSPNVVTGTCAEFADDKAFACGCSAAVNFYCKSLCNSCNGNYALLTASKCENREDVAKAGASGSSVLPIVFAAIGTVFVLTIIVVAVVFARSKRSKKGKDDRGSGSQPQKVVSPKIAKSEGSLPAVREQAPKGRLPPSNGRVAGKEVRGIARTHARKPARKTPPTPR